MIDPKEILRRFGHESFRPAQEEIINAALEGRNTLALLPTGGGKSLCFQIPALAKEGICIVISPLIALMQDQVNNLKSKGIKAMSLGGRLAFNELDTLLDNCIHGNYKFLYLSPERLQMEIVQNRIARMNVNFIVVDEAHCVSQWGHDFRPAYLKIPALKKTKPEATWMALTATATPKVMEDMLGLLEIDEPKIVRKSFERENISFQVIEREDKFHNLLKILEKNPGSSIIYMRNRKESMELARFLNEHGESAEAYHGGTSSEDRKKFLKEWLDGKIRAIVATSAFGMGIDKPDVRTVIHYHLPESLESYYQEAGRAGRDGKPSKAIILCNKPDLGRVEKQFVSVLPTVKSTKEVYRKLQSYFGIAYGEGENTLHDFNFYDFCQTYGFNMPKTHKILELLDRMGVISLTKQYQKKSVVQVLVSNKQLLFYLDENIKCENLVKTILRTYPGVFDYETDIDLGLLKSKTGLSEKEIAKFLEDLSNEKIISLLLAKHDANIVFLVPREDDLTINPFSKYIEQQYKQKQERVASVLDYATDKTTCKNRKLLAYFGEKTTEDCGICSVCLERKRGKSNVEVKTIRKNILGVLENGSFTSNQIIEKTGFQTDDVLNVLRDMLAHGIVGLTGSNEYFLNTSK
jgi:ATP-dependent DNA helicase RecQ